MSNIITAYKYLSKAVNSCYDDPDTTYEYVNKAMNVLSRAWNMKENTMRTFENILAEAKRPEASQRAKDEWREKKNKEDPKGAAKRNAKAEDAAWRKENEAKRKANAKDKKALAASKKRPVRKPVKEAAQTPEQRRAMADSFDDWDEFGPGSKQAFIDMDNYMPGTEICEECGEEMIDGNCPYCDIDEAGMMSDDGIDPDEERQHEIWKAAGLDDDSLDDMGNIVGPKSEEDDFDDDFDFEQLEDEDDYDEDELGETDWYQQMDEDFGPDEDDFEDEDFDD